MIANYKNKGIPPSAGFIMGMSAKEARAWDMTEARAALRELSSGADYTLQATGKNVEDFYMMEELRKRGVNLKQWEDSTQIDPKTGEITFGPWEPPKGGRRS